MAAATPVFATHGCRLNACETEAMREMAGDAGLGDAVVVNTCAVTAEAVRKARQDIRKLRRENPSARLIVTGCAAQTEPSTFSAMPEVDMVVGNLEKMRTETWARLAEEPLGDVERNMVGDVMSATEAADCRGDGFGRRARAHVQIQNGCDHRCTFCIIPYGRGNSRSATADAIVERIGRLAERGCNEVVLTGVDLTNWGAELPGGPRLGDLVLRILRETPDLPRLRLSSMDSIEADDALMRAIAEEPRLMPHLHLSLQSGDDMILKRMKRRHLRDDAIRFCEEARRLRPGIVFGADIIAGFPTETEAMFENSLRLVEECGLTWLHVFPYSQRPGTPASRMPQVDGRAIRERAARLRAAGEARARKHLDRQIGRELSAVVERPRMARAEDFTGIALASDRIAGSLDSFRIEGHDGARLIAA